MESVREEVERLLRIEREVSENEVGFGEELVEDLLTLVGVEIEGNALFIAVGGKERGVAIPWLVARIAIGVTGGAGEWADRTAC